MASLAFELLDRGRGDFDADGSRSARGPEQVEQVAGVTSEIYYDGWLSPQVLAH